MRGVLLFIAISVIVLIANPTACWLVQSEVGAAPGVIIEQDGVPISTFSGPKSPWPEWAAAPEGAKLTPASYYADAPGHPSMGWGRATLAEDPADAVPRLTEALAAAGWTVTPFQYRMQEPSLPPKWIAGCSVMARRGKPGAEQTVLYGFVVNPAERGVMIHWRAGPPLPPWQTVDTLPEWTQPKAGCDPRPVT